MKNRIHGALAVITLVSGACFSLLGPASAQADKTILVPDTIIDFKPETGSSYNIEWAGPPRRELDYADVKFYIPSLTLGGPAATSYTSKIKLMAYRRWWWDKKIGEFEAVYTAGSKEPTLIRYSSAVPGSVAPTNAPAETTGKFWLGCTKLGRVKGNLAFHDTETVVYLQEEDRAVSADTTAGGRLSPRHTVRCGDFGSSSSGSGSNQPGGVGNQPGGGGGNIPGEPQAPPGGHPL